MGVRFAPHPVGELGHRPFFRAEGESEIAHLIAGKLSVSAVGGSKEGSTGSRKRFVVDLPVSQARPWRVRRTK
jgi:hypothetical protein